MFQCKSSRPNRTGLYLFKVNKGNTRIIVIGVSLVDFVLVNAGWAMKTMKNNFTPNFRNFMKYGFGEFRF